MKAIVEMWKYGFRQIVPLMVALPIVFALHFLGFTLLGVGFFGGVLTVCLIQTLFDQNVKG